MDAQTRSQTLYCALLNTPNVVLQVLAAAHGLGELHIRRLVAGHLGHQPTFLRFLLQFNELMVRMCTFERGAGRVGHHR